MQPALTPLEHQQLRVADGPAATFWHEVRFELVRRCAVRRKATAVIDIGAGSGLLGDHLAATGLDYRFAESSEALRDGLVRRFGPAAERSIDDPVAADDVVAVLDVVEHLEHDTEFLRRLGRAMDPGATMVLTVPAIPWLFSSWDVDLGHVRRYTRHGASITVEAAGFDVVEAAYLFPELVPPALLRRWRSSDGTRAEFPSLPRWLDRAARTISTATATIRRVWPVGTSVFIVATRSGLRP